MCVPGAEEPASERKRLWQALKSRVVYSALFQPSPLFFVVCLFLLAACMPLLAAYLGRASLLPDLDTMKYWNAYLGNLNSQKFCVLNSSDGDTWSETYNDCNRTFIGRVDFVLPEQDRRRYLNMYDHLSSCVSGRQLDTKIEDKWTRARVDNNVTVCIEVSLNDTGSCDGDVCHVRACVFISAPAAAVPVSNIPVDRDLAFSTVLKQHPNKYKQLSDSCKCTNTRNGAIGNLALSSSEHCKDMDSIVQAGREVYSHHGLLTIYLSKNDLAVASFRIRLSAVFFVVCGLLFAVAVILIG